MHPINIAVLCTGGIDSTTLLYLLKSKGYNPIPITVNYGQCAFEKQVEMLTYHIAELNLPQLVQIDIKFCDFQKTPGLFTPGYIPQEDSPLENWDRLRYADFFIEGRNTIMLAYALAYCAANKVDELHTGYLYSEVEWRNRRSIKLMTGDNSPQFVDTFNILSQFGFSYQCRIRSIFYEERMAKEDVIALGKQLGVNYEMTYSCYFVPECGVCDNCLIRNSLNL